MLTRTRGSLLLTGRTETAHAKPWASALEPAQYQDKAGCGEKFITAAPLHQGAEPDFQSYSAHLHKSAQNSGCGRWQPTYWSDGCVAVRRVLTRIVSR